MARWKRIVLGLVVMSVVAGIIIGVSWVRRPSSIQLSEEPKLTPATKIVIFAPHSDDETLGTGGIVKKAANAGSQTTVVLITNGDGFRYAATDLFRKLSLPPRKFVEFGYIRQQESLSALSFMDQPVDRVIFLGYPDHGLSKLWTTNWDYSELFTSPFTKQDRTPYLNSYQLAAPYCGLAVVDNIKSILKAVKPDIIFLPHPNDAHPDHWATNAFVTIALRELADEGEPFASKVKANLYLVHRGSWPQPRGVAMKLPLEPPAKLVGVGTRWFKVSLSDSEIRGKLDAILHYRSQITLLRRFLVSFARRNELFGVIPPATLPRLAVSNGPEIWTRMEPLIRDPERDTISRELEGNADILAVYAARDDRNFLIRVRLREAPSIGINYLVHVYSFSPQWAPTVRRRDFNIEMKPPRLVSVKGRGGKPVKLMTPVVVRSGSRELQATISLADLGKPETLYLEAETFFGPAQIDRTAWRAVRVNDGR